MFRQQMFIIFVDVVSDEDEELDITGLDDEEIDSYIMSSEEIKQKSKLWMMVRLEYLTLDDDKIYLLINNEVKGFEH